MGGCAVARTTRAQKRARLSLSAPHTWAPPPGPRPAVRELFGDPERRQAHSPSRFHGWSCPEPVAGLTALIALHPSLPTPAQHGYLQPQPGHYEAAKGKNKGRRRRRPRGLSRTRTPLEPEPGGADQTTGTRASAKWSGRKERRKAGRVAIGSVKKRALEADSSRRKRIGCWLRRDRSLSRVTGNSVHLLLRCRPRRTRDRLKRGALGVGEAGPGSWKRACAAPSDTPGRTSTLAGQLLGWVEWTEPWACHLES